MGSTLVIQSHRSPLPWPWIARCLDSVRLWCEMNGYEYRFMGDELFDCLPATLLEKTQHQRVIATDLARLLTLQNALESGYETVVWIDADFLVFNPSAFSIPDETCALGREVWVQHDKQGNGGEIGRFQFGCGHRPSDAADSNAQAPPKHVSASSFRDPH